MVEDRTPVASEPQSSVAESKPPPTQNRWFIIRPKLIFALLLYKALVLGAAFAYAKFAPGSFSVDGYQANFHRHEQPGFAERFSTWDGEHYLSLSERG